MTWQRLDLSPDAAAALRTAYEAAFERAGRPRNAALFQVAAEGSVEVYFSPGAAALFEAQLRALGAKRAGAPPCDAVLAVGDPLFWKPA
jgi:hypothetical protein